MDDRDYTLIDEAFNAQEKTYKAEWQKCERLFASKHEKRFLDRARTQNRSALFVPAIQNTILIAYSVFTSSFLNARATPIKARRASRDDEARAESDALNLLLAHYWAKSKPRLAISQAFLSALLFRLGAMAIWWDESKNAPSVLHVPTSDLAFDQYATNCQDPEFVAYRYAETPRRLLERIKSKYYEPNAKDKEALQRRLENETRRLEIKEIYRRSSDGWICKTYLDGTLLRKRSFKDIPFKWGIALPNLPLIDRDLRDRQILVYGDSFIRLMEQIQDEINIKRNQKNDIQEERINPSAIIDTDKVAIDPSALKVGAGKRIAAKTTGSFGLNSAIVFRPAPPEYELNSDLQLLNHDMENATGVNGILRGATNPSDRRSQAALAMVNSNSSARLEDMIALLNDTLFEHLAKTFARLVYKNAPDELVMELCGGVNPLGAKGARKSFDYNIEVEFGVSINTQTTVNNLISVIQMLGQNQSVQPEITQELLKEAITLMLGDTARVEEMFAAGANAARAQAEQAQAEAEAQAQNQANIDAAIAEQERLGAIQKYVNNTL
jgi:hypothetical protein